VPVDTFFFIRAGIFRGRAVIVVSTIHDGPGVIPGRYAGESIRISDGPTPQEVAYQKDKAHADGLAGRICAAAAQTARSTCTLLELVGEFDASNAIRFWTDVKSVAHWLSWACSMSPGAAREHVRVAKALRRMPSITSLFREGRLSYSKVREVTRVVDVIDEQRLAGLALTATAAHSPQRSPGSGPPRAGASGNKTNGESAGANARTAWLSYGPGCRRRTPPCCWLRSRVRRTSLGHHHPNPGRAVIKRSQTRCPVSGCTAAQMRCWMWPGCF